ncbi:MAG: hypothetical protein HYX69_07405 [Planctomycetia bacterium]|nr:hypothetical protein [Planctomycetia bacterium]
MTASLTSRTRNDPHTRSPASRGSAHYLESLPHTNEVVTIESGVDAVGASYLVTGGQGAATTSASAPPDAANDEVEASSTVNVVALPVRAPTETAAAPDNLGFAARDLSIAASIARPMCAPLT